MQEDKKRLRREIRENLRLFLAQGEYSECQTAGKIWQRLENLKPFRQANSILVYLNMPNELPTFPLLNALFLRYEADCSSPSFRSVAVPWCDGLELKLFRLEPADKLNPAASPLLLSDGASDYFSSSNFQRDFCPGSYGIWEPKESSRQKPDREVFSSEIDLVLVPGMAFDRNKNRLGHGAGYYDRFFEKLRPGTVLIGLAFDCQLVDEVPTESHDRPMDFIVTPNYTI